MLHKFCALCPISSKHTISLMSVLGSTPHLTTYRNVTILTSVGLQAEENQRYSLQRLEDHNISQPIGKKSNVCAQIAELNISPSSQKE